MISLIAFGVENKKNWVNAFCLVCLPGMGGGCPENTRFSIKHRM